MSPPSGLCWHPTSLCFLWIAVLRGTPSRRSASPRPRPGAAEEPRPSLGRSDIETPGLSGVELLERLKALDQTIQVVMVTGVQQMDTVRQCVRAGAYDYITKPFEVDALIATVERAVERARLIRQNEEYRQSLERMVRE